MINPTRTVRLLQVLYATSPHGPWSAPSYWISMNDLRDWSQPERQPGFAAERWSKSRVIEIELPPDDAAPPAAASASPQPEAEHDTTSGDALMVDELAKQYQKAQIYGSKAQKWRTEALNHGSKTYNFDADPCTDEKALAFARDVLRRAREADAQGCHRGGLARPADASCDEAALAGARCRVCGHFELDLSRAEARYAHCPSCGHAPHWVRVPAADARPSPETPQPDTETPFGPVGSRRFGAMAPEVSPDAELARLVEELDALCRKVVGDMNEATREQRLTKYHDALTMAWPALSAALRQSATVQRQLIGMTGERDAERLISQEWEEKCDALKKRLGEAEAKLKEAVAANAQLILSMGGSIGVDEPQDPTT